MKGDAFLKYYKTILEKVSFDQLLLAKEYKKALQTIQPSDHAKLDQWMIEKGLKEKINNSNQFRQTA